MLRWTVILLAARSVRVFILYHLFALGYSYFTSQQTILLEDTFSSNCEIMNNENREKQYIIDSSKPVRS